MPSRFVILGVQRTGTTWIRTTLNSHPSVLALGEVFLYSHSRFSIGGKAGLDVANSYRHFIEKSARRRILHSFNRRRMVAEYLQQLYAQPDFDAIGFKLMRTHCRQFPTVLDYLLSEKISAIHVVRLNVLKTLISRETARQRKLYHATNRVSVKKIAIDVKSLLPALGQIVAENSAWQQMFKDSPYLRVNYESFVSNRDAELQRMCSFLSVQPDTNVSSALIKINPDSIGDLLINYDEVYRALQGTSFASCLS